MAIGANDVGWSNLLELCYPVAPGSPGIGDACLEPRFTTPVIRRLERLSRRFDKLAEGLHRLGITPGSAYMNDYWDPTRNGGDNGNVYSEICPNEVHHFLFAFTVVASAKVRECGSGGTTISSCR
jgi:hypothetical protein